MERFARAAGSLSRDRAPGHDEVLALAEAHGIEITRSLDEALRETGGEKTDKAQPSARRTSRSPGSPATVTASSTNTASIRM